MLGFVERLNIASNRSLFASIQTGSTSEPTILRIIAFLSSGVRVVFGAGTLILSPALAVTTDRVPARMRCVTRKGIVAGLTVWYGNRSICCAITPLMNTEYLLSINQTITLINIPPIEYPHNATSFQFK